MKKYNIVYIDTPWYDMNFRRSYIENLNLRELVDDKAILLFWFPIIFLPDCLKLLERWGFEYLTLMTWQIPKSSDERLLFKSSADHCFVGHRGDVSGFGWHTQNLFELPEGPAGQKPERFRWLMANWGQEAFPDPSFLDVFGAYWHRKDPNYGADIWSVLPEETMMPTGLGEGEDGGGFLQGED